MIWTLAGSRAPSPAELAALDKAANARGVRVMRMGGGQLGEAVWAHEERQAFDPVAWPGAGRRWSLERWGPTLFAALRGERNDRTTAMAGCGSVSIGLAGALVYWPGIPSQTLSGVRELGCETISIGSLADA